MDIFSSDFHVYYRDCTLIQALKLSMSSIMIPSCERLKENTLLLRAREEGQELTRHLSLPLSNTAGWAMGRLGRCICDATGGNRTFPTRVGR
jgi:hypothetical protein